MSSWALKEKKLYKKYSASAMTKRDQKGTKERNE